MTDSNLQDRKVGEAESPFFQPLSKEEKETGDAQSASISPETIDTPPFEDPPVRSLHGVKVNIAGIYTL